MNEDGDNMNLQNLKKIATILHTLYCKKPHEMQMELFQQSSKCQFYLEDSIDRTWEMDEHREWLKQAQCLVSISHPLDTTEILGDILKIYQLTEKLKKANPKIIGYVKALLV